MKTWLDVMVRRLPVRSKKSNVKNCKVFYKEGVMQEEIDALRREARREN
jgi:hypothetical protein